jgi:hypothetical protein
MQQMKVLPEELMVHLGSYPRGAGGDKCVEAAETEALVWGSCKHAGRNASEARASLEMKNAGVELFRKQRRPQRWIWPRTSLWIHLPTGVMGAARMQAPSGDTGDLRWLQDNLQTADEAGHPQESEGLVVPMKSVNADGGKGPWFRVRLGEPRIWGSA